MPSLIDLLFSDLRAGEKSLRRLLAVGGLFAFVGHFYVVEPYFRYKEQESAAETAIRESEASVQALEGRLAQLSATRDSVDETMEEIRLRIDRYPDQLRDSLGEIATLVHDDRGEPPPQQQQQPQHRTGPTLSDGTVLPGHVPSFEEGATWYVDQWFATLIRDLRAGVVEPVLALEGEGGTELATRLASDANAAEREFREHVDGIDPDFWMQYRNKVDVAGQVASKVNELFAPLLVQITTLLDGATNGAAEQKLELETAREAYAQIESDRAELEVRLTSLESPLGRIPVGLVDLIELFPLLTLTWVGMLAGTMRRLNDLQTAFLGELDKSGDDTDMKRRLGAFAVCWFMPPDKRLARQLALALVLVPGMLVAARAALLVARHARHIIANSDIGIVPERGLMWIYMFGFLIVAVIVVRAWRNLSG